MAGHQSKRKRSWSRAVFSNLQRKGLEKRFEVQKYVTKPDRRQLAAMLGLTDAQVILLLKLKKHASRSCWMLTNETSQEQQSRFQSWKTVLISECNKSICGKRRLYKENSKHCIIMQISTSRLYICTRWIYIVQLLVTILSCKLICITVAHVFWDPPLVTCPIHETSV